MTHKKAPNNHSANKSKNNNKQNNRAQNRKQSPDNRASSNSNTNTHTSQEICEHYDKAINSTSFRKAINHIQSVQCCKKSPKNPYPTPCQNEPKLGNQLFACTQCGAVVCLAEKSQFAEKSQIEQKAEDSEKENVENSFLENSDLHAEVSGFSHAHEHHATPRSDCHALFLQLKGEILYCVPCEKRLTVEGSKIMVLQSLIKKAKGCWTMEVKNSFENEAYAKTEPSNNQSKKNSQQSKNDSSSPNRSPKSGPGKEMTLKREVRGFSNLGNTCFFNSVMQNIMQTTWLRQVMLKMSDTQSIHLDAKTKLDFPEFGSMSESLVQLYKSYFSGGTTQTMAPKMVFQSLCQFCPMFKSREQQDSQEMFSCLVNALFEEDEKRVKDAIMERYGIKEDTNKQKDKDGSASTTTTKVDSATRASVKREWKQAQPLNPVSAVFGGMLTKYIKCNHCSNINTKSEPFISLSLSLSSTSSDSTSNSGAPSFASPRKHNSNSFSKNEKGSSPDGDSSQPQTPVPSSAPTKRRKALSENKPPPEVDMPLKPTTTTTKAVVPTVSPEPSIPTCAPMPPNWPLQDDTSPVSAESPDNQKELVVTEVDEDPDLIMPDDIFGFESDKITTDTTSEEVFLTETSTEPEQSSSEKSPLMMQQISNVSSPFEELAVKVADVSVNDSSDIASSKSSTASPRDQIDTSNAGSLLKNAHSSYETELDKVDGLPKNSKPTTGSIDSAYASQTSLAVGQNTVDSGSISGSSFSPTSNNNQEADSFHDDSRGLSREDSFDEDTKVGDNSDASSENLCLDGLFMEPETDNKTEPCENFDTNIDDNDDDDDDDHNENKVQKGVTSKQEDENDELFCPSSGSTISSRSMADSLIDPIEALYMSTLSDGVYQPKENEVSIMSLLKNFINLEYLTGCNKIKCDKCSVNDNRNLSDACVWYRITSSPSVLVLHIKRFAQFGLRLRKLNTFVTIQPVLDIAPFCSPDCPTESKSKSQNRILYKLYGVVEHSGSLHSGHYTAYVCQRGSCAGDNLTLFKSQNATDIVSTLMERLSGSTNENSVCNVSGKGKMSHDSSDTDDCESSSSLKGERESCLNNVWYYISDTVVKQVPLSKVLNSSPYMLFYEKIVT